MINDKYRISEVAKDLNVPMKELVELLEKQFPGEKKRTTALSNEELNFVFETYTQKNQMDSLDSYYAYREESKVPQAKSKPEKEKKEQQQKKAQPKPEEKPAETVAESPGKRRTAAGQGGCKIPTGTARSKTGAKTGRTGTTKAGIGSKGSGCPRDSDGEGEAGYE